MLKFVQHLLLRSSFILESVIGSLYGRGPRGPALSSQPTSWPHTAHDWPTKWLVNQESWSCPLHYHAKLGLLTQKPFVRTTQGILKSWWGPHKALPVLNKHLVTKQLSFHTHFGPIAQDILLAKACGAFKYVCIRAFFSLLSIANSCHCLVVNCQWKEFNRNCILDCSQRTHTHQLMSFTTKFDCDGMRSLTLENLSIVSRLESTWHLRP